MGGGFRNLLEKIFCGTESEVMGLGKRRLVRDLKREALARLEESARTLKDFEELVKIYDRLDENFERKVRYHEIGRPEELLEYGSTGGVVIPSRCPFPAWREAMRGDFLPLIFGSAEDMWHLVDDKDVALAINGLTAKQKDVLHLTAIEGLSPQQIAALRGVTDRAVRKLLAAALVSVRKKLEGRQRLDTS